MKLSEASELIETGLNLSNLTKWTDLGCGSGIFTHALAKKLSPGSMIYAIDKDEFLIESVNGVHIENVQMDFARSPLPFSRIDGILMANSFHFISNKDSFIKSTSQILKKNGIWIIVEYDTDRANRWVPFPVSFNSLKSLFERANVTKMRSVPSVYRQASIYSAMVQNHLEQ